MTGANAAVLEPVEQQWRFSHDKLREATLRSIPASERPALHRQIAEAIEQVYPDTPEQAVVLAAHWRAAEDPAREFAMLQKAGDYALHISALSDAVSSFARALELQPTLAISKSNAETALAAGLRVKLPTQVRCRRAGTLARASKSTS